MLDNQGDPQTYAIIGAAMEVHRELGRGFLEAVYQDALAYEFGIHGIPYRPEVDISITYKEIILPSKYRADFICYEDIVVELKAQTRLIDNDKAQVFNYLKATTLRRALLINFGARQLEYRRIVNDYAE